MAVETFAGVVRGVQTNSFRSRRIADVLHPDVMQATPFRSNAPIEGVVRVAGVTSLVGRNAMVLEVCRRNVVRVIYGQTLPVRLHDVTRQTERRLLGSLHMVRE